MVLPSARSTAWTYLAMAGLAVVVFAAFTIVSDPVTRDEPAPQLPIVTVAPAPSVDGDFRTTELGGPRLVHAGPYCTARRCCPTTLRTFGTTVPVKDVIASFEAQGYSMLAGDRAVIRPGRWPSVRWTAELGFAGRWKWRRVEVARGPDVDRPEWPTVFAQSSVACGES
ncbi:hypothetical protein BH18ACT17_BH18ACT17_14820 [soil metagenome]